MIKAGIIFLGASIFFAGAAFQETIQGTSWDRPDGGYGSMVLAIYLFVTAYGLITKARRQ